MINQAASFASRLIVWQTKCGRHDLPWQQTRDPYRVWLSEIMLQQTQVATVLDYYRRFLQRFPDLAALARAPLDEVMAQWSGLGYYARARNLHACARVVVDQHGGRWPQDPARLVQLPGIGQSTANAIAAFCFGLAVPILDGNVKRVLCRHFGIRGLPATPAVDRELWRLAAVLLPSGEPGPYLQAQMDLGATVCTRARPRCADCPLAASCVALRQDCVAELPQRKPPRALPERHTRMLLLQAEGRVLLLRRPPVGIWGGLLSLPELPPGADAQAYAASALGCAVDSFTAQPPVRHSFTHFHLEIQPLLGQARRLPQLQAEAGQLWLARGELTGAALPTPIRKLLRACL